MFPITIWRRALSRVQFIPDARRILARAWSLRGIELAAIVDIILNVVPYVSDWLPWWLTLVLLGLAWGARLIAQPEKEKVIANQQDPAVEAGR
jgi:hypothetical protein